MPWFKDPISRQPSVPLTLLVLASILMVTFTILESYEIIKSTHLLDEFWGSAVALYGGHIFAFKDNFRDNRWDNPQGETPTFPPKSNIQP